MVIVCKEKKWAIVKHVYIKTINHAIACYSKQENFRRFCNTLRQQTYIKPRQNCKLLSKTLSNATLAFDIAKIL